MKSTRTSILSAAIMAAASLAVGSGAYASPSPQSHAGSKGAILRFPQALTKRQLKLLANGRSYRRARKAWPYSGKNRAQRQRLSAAFLSMA